MFDVVTVGATLLTFAFFCDVDVVLITTAEGLGLGGSFAPWSDPVHLMGLPFGNMGDGS